MWHLHKRLFFVIIVIAPIYWLVISDDGQRRADAVLLWLVGEESMEFNLKELSSHFTEEDLKTVYQDHQWQCQDRDTAFGNRLCVAKIGNFNEIPAKYITVFFADKWVNAIKMVYYPVHHNQLLLQLRQQLGPAEVNENPNDSVLRWNTEHGTVISKKALADDEEAALLWLSLQQFK